MAKQAKTDRQAVIDSIRSQQSKSENRRGLAIVGVCVLVAVLIVGAAAFKPIKDWYDLRAYSADSLTDIGAKACSIGPDWVSIAEIVDVSPDGSTITSSPGLNTPPATWPA